MIILHSFDCNSLEFELGSHVYEPNARVISTEIVDMVHATGLIEALGLRARHDETDGR